MICPPNTGSTAIADFVGQLPEISGLNSTYEGQWLIPGMRADRWNADKNIDLRSVRAVWLDAVRKQRRGGETVQYVMEKSPPHMMRHRLIMSVLAETRVVCYNRNPFANVSSIAHRYHDLANRPEDERAEICAGIAGTWLDRSRRVMDIVAAEACPLLTYEGFCQAPEEIFPAFGFPRETLERVSRERAVRVKDHEPQGITNMNARQVGRLGAAELDAIGKVIAPHRELLQFYGYCEDPEQA